MPHDSGITVVNVGDRSTNYWVVSAGKSRILVDLGWPGRMGALKANLDRMDVPIHEIRYGLATHFHIDHAGAAENLKQVGIPLLVLDIQIFATERMKTWTKPEENYLEISEEGNVVITAGESRLVLNDMGISGEIVPTPGHSEDSVSLLLDDGRVFTGDLTRPELIYQDNPEVVFESWRHLNRLGAREVYPGHGPIYIIDPSSFK